MASPAPSTALPSFARSWVKPAAHPPDSTLSRSAGSVPGSFSFANRYVASPASPKRRLELEFEGAAILSDVDERADTEQVRAGNLPAQFLLYDVIMPFSEWSVLAVHALACPTLCNVWQASKPSSPFL